MKFLYNHTMRRNILLLSGALALSLTCLKAQPTPVPTEFSDWTGAVSADFFDTRNWSTGVVPNSPTAAIRLRSDSSIPNKTIDMIYTGVGDVRYKFYSIQTGASYLYTIRLAGTENGWLEWNPLVKGFTFNGEIDPASGSSITAPNSSGNETNRNSVNVELNSYSRITLDDSYNSMLRANNGLTLGVFSLHGNAEINITNAANATFMDASGPATITTAVLTLGGLKMDKGTVFNIGTYNRDLAINGSGRTGDVLEMAGLIEWQSPVARTLRILGSGVTLVTGTLNHPNGTVNIYGENTQYIVDGVHNSAAITNRYSTSVLGGSGIINCNTITMATGILTPGRPGTASNGPLTINGTLVFTGGGLSLDLVTATSYDELVINGALVISDKATLAIGRAETFPMVSGTYTLVEVNGPITGQFLEKNVGLPVSMSLKPSWRWRGNKLEVSFEQLPFASNSLVTGRHRVIAQHIDNFIGGNAVPEALYDALNRQPSVILFNNVLDQLSPMTFQSWYPAAIVRTNSMVQNMEDMLYQDAAFGRKKDSVRTFLQGYRQEFSRSRNELAAYSNYSVQALVTGVDYAFGPKFVAGGFVEYEKTEFDLDTAGGTSEMDSYTFGLKARYNTGKLQVNAVAFYGTDDYDTTRSVSATQVANWARSEANGSRFGAAASLAYTFLHRWSEIEITPTAGVQWMNWKTQAFQETGAKEISLYVYEQNETSLQGKLGVRIARSVKTKRGLIRPFFNYTFIHEFESDPRILSARLFGNRMDIDAPGSNANGYRLDVGLDWSATEKIRVELRYTSEFRSACDESRGIRGGVNYTF